MSKEKVLLKVEERKEKGTAASRRMRRSNKIPGVIYSKGSAGDICLDVKEWKKLAGKDVHLVDLEFNTGKQTKALIKDVQEDFLKGTVLHVDFQEVRMDQIITSVVSVHAKVGSVPVGLSKGGVLDQPMYEIEVSCLPGDLPDAIEVDISALDINDAIHVKDIILPQGVKAASEPDLIVFHVLAQKVETETTATEAAAEGAAAEPVVLKEKEKEEKAEAKKGGDKEK